MYDIEPKLTEIINRSSHEEFIFDFLMTYEIPKSSIDRIRKWELNKLDQTWEFIIRKKVHFQYSKIDLYASIDAIKNSIVTSKNKPRFVIVTNFEKFLAFDSKIWDSLDIEFNKLDKHYDFFNPLRWIEKQQYQNENIADVKAANNLAKLFDEIVKDNDHTIGEKRHALNIFLSRLLFCFFAEDTNIFESGKFTNSLASHTKIDGSDMHIYLDKLFEVFNLEIRNDSFVEYLRSFPYVNGKLFQDKYEIPKFTTKSRKLLIELWQLDWSGINPDIFWSMMQGVMDTEERANLWSHYTSVPNIMKVIQPLFLDELYESFEECNGNQNKLKALLVRISKIKFFDPACGSGNFLIIVYKEIRRLEIQILKEIWAENLLIWSSHISLSQFYGIEINDFAHETAKLSLYLAEHQMNLEFTKEVWTIIKSLPLRVWGKIICGNACRIDREQVCPKNEWDEIYIMWNPPYYGSRKQTNEQKADLEIVFRNDYKSLDYIAARFYLWANYIRWVNAKLAFVSTNSISQWEQVNLTRPRVLQDSLDIYFAYQSFKWQNNAKDNAWVTVVIIGLENLSKWIKYIYINQLKQEVENISPYLIEGKTIYIESRTKPISCFPDMDFWNMAADGWKLLFTDNQRLEFIKNEPQSEKRFKKILSAQEFLNWSNRWCLWLESISENELSNLPLIKKRVEELKHIREESSRPELAKISHLFAQITQQANSSFILVPRVSSENRKYIPIWFFSEDYKSSDSCLTVSTEELYILWILTSYMHMIWVKNIWWKLETRYRYSKNVIYNTFPFPYITKKQKEEIEWYVYAVLDQREKHSEKTLAQMYDPNKMPEWLKQAHHELDLAIERCYRPKPFESDEERLEYLFKLYERMIAKEKEDNN